MLLPKITLTLAVHANKERLRDLSVMANWLHFSSSMLLGRVYRAILSLICLFQTARILSSYLLIEWPRWPTLSLASSLPQPQSLRNCLFLTLSDSMVFPIQLHQIVAPSSLRTSGLSLLSFLQSTFTSPLLFTFKRMVKQNTWIKPLKPTSAASATTIKTTSLNYCHLLNLRTTTPFKNPSKCHLSLLITAFTRILWLNHVLPLHLHLTLLLSLKNSRLTSTAFTSASFKM